MHVEIECNADKFLLRAILDLDLVVPANLFTGEAKIQTGKPKTTRRFDVGRTLHIGYGSPCAQTIDTLAVGTMHRGPGTLNLQYTFGELFEELYVLLLHAP